MTPKSLYTILYTNLPRKVIFCDTITYHPKTKNPGFTGICDVLIFCEMVGRASSLSAKLADFQRVFFYTQLNTQKLGYHQAL